PPPTAGGREDDPWPNTSLRCRPCRAPRRVRPAAAAPRRCPRAHERTTLAKHYFALPPLSGSPPGTPRGGCTSPLPAGAREDDLGQTLLCAAALVGSPPGTPPRRRTPPPPPGAPEEDPCQTQICAAAPGGPPPAPAPRGVPP